MGEFDDLENKAESFAREHPQEVDKGLQEAGQLADRETGNKYDSEIQGAVGAAEKAFGGSDPNQVGQDQSGQAQDQGQGWSGQT